MFGDVWAGWNYRTSERNLVIDAWRIPTAVRDLVDDVKAWIENEAYELDETAVWFHHKLVSIHPFSKWKRPSLSFDGRSSGHEAKKAAVYLGWTFIGFNF